MIIEVLIYIAVGIFSGIFSGLLGIGGGILIVPSLFFIYSYLETNITSPMHLAIGTSLAIITVSSIAAMVLYQKRQAIFWSVFKKLNIPLILGSILGVFVSYLLSSKLLSQLFAFFAFFAGVYFLFVKKIYKRMKKPEKLLIIVAGLIIGFSATILGIGGGAVAMTFFIMLLRVPNYSLIGSAATATFITSIVGSLSFLISGFNIAGNPNSIGYIHLPAFLIIGLVSIFSVSLGIKLADRIQIRLLKKIFGAILVITSMFMFFK